VPEPISLADGPATSKDAAAAIICEVQLLDDTIDYLIGWRAHRRSQLKGVLAALGQKSTSKLVRGVTLKLVPYETLVCECHGDDPAACPAAAAGNAIAIRSVPNGEGISLEFDDDYIRRRPLPLDPAPQELPRTAAPPRSLAPTTTPATAAA
jgi:hypothetical protein